MTLSQAESDREHDAMATVLIIGASRGIGLEAVKAALAAGHSVRALARSARRIRLDHPKLEKMAGDALGLATVKRALTGADVVIQSLGVAAGLEAILKPTRFFSKAARVLVTARAHRDADYRNRNLYCRKQVGSLSQALLASLSLAGQEHGRATTQPRRDPPRERPLSPCRRGPRSSSCDGGRWL
jgi:NAD(P)-dependent dehydrogenase (short-subunit alcohol dehydrogenase family)